MPLKRHARSQAKYEELIGIINIDKARASISLLDPSTGRLMAYKQREFQAVDGPVVRQLDVAEMEQWLRSTIAALPQRNKIRTLVPIAHGAAAVLLDEHNKVLIAPDYEDIIFETVAGAYRKSRDAFAATFSPFLPCGLNLGRQLFYLQTRHPQLFSKAKRLLLYPQYWAFRLCGEMASELTSLSCHSDLWQPLAAQPSRLADRQGWTELLPPLRPAADSLGTISEDFAEGSALSPECRVLCGIHNSSAAFLAHLTRRSAQDCFAVISSDIWTVVMAHGIDLARIREALDISLTTSAFGTPVAMARFMGGREYEAIAGHGNVRPYASRADLNHVFALNAFALPSFASAGGPFAGRAPRLIATEALDQRQRNALATLYIALVTDFLLEALAVQGDVIIEGVLARNALYTRLIAALRQQNKVFTRSAFGSPATAASYLASTRTPIEDHLSTVEYVAIPGLSNYRKQWRDHIHAEQHHDVARWGGQS